MNNHTIHSKTTHSEATPHVEERTNEVEVFDEDGALSRAFLLQRGFCCENGCKNCPYGFNKTSRIEERTGGAA